MQLAMISICNIAWKKCENIDQITHFSSLLKFCRAVGMGVEFVKLFNIGIPGNEDSDGY